MRWLLAALAWGVGVPALIGADWIRVNSPNFELYTTSSEREARATLDIFEQARDFFLRVKSTALAARLPVTLVGFGDAKDYRPYSLKSFTPAYFVADEQRDYIVMSDLGADRTRAAIHEYVHLLVRDSGFALPVWLNEGMADVYSTFAAQDGKIMVGSIPRDRNYALTHEKWMRLPAMVAVGMNSPEYNEQERAGIFYGQSWLLAHMLMLGDGYAAKFPMFLAEVSASGSSQNAFSSLYGKTLAEVERDMSAYFRQSTIGGAVYRGELQKVDIGPARPSTDLETALTLATLTALLGRTGEASDRLEKLAGAHPDDPEVEQALAYLDWRRGNLDRALGRFEQALTHGAGGWKIYWDYARLSALGGREREPRLAMVRKALELKPDLTEARLMLGQELYGMGRYAEALAELRQIPNIDPPHATLLFVTLAYLSAQLSQPSEARRYAEEARKYARTPSQTASVDSLLEDLENRAASSSPGLPPPPPDVDDPGPPILRHRGSQRPAPQPR